MDLDLNAQQNARMWHSDRKARSAKQAKTLDANKRALAEADKKVQVQLSKVNSPMCPLPFGRPPIVHAFSVLGSIIFTAMFSPGPSQLLHTFNFLDGHNFVVHLNAVMEHQVPPCAWP